MPLPGSRAGSSGIHLLALLLLACALLSACSPEDKGARQRENFKLILQRNILDKKGIRFPPLTEEQKRNLGPYAGQYILLNSLSEDEELLSSFSGLPELQQKLMRAMDPAEKQVLIDEAAEHLETIREKLIAAYKKIRRSKRALKQPDDVRGIYEEAYLKVIQAPTDLLVDLIDQSLEAVKAATALNQYMMQHPDAARYQDSTVLIQKPEAEAEIDGLFEAYKEKSDRALQTVRDLNNLTW